MLQILFFVVLGLVLFFSGMHLAELGLVRGSGQRLKKILQLFTANLGTGILTGTLVTAIMQSSSAVSVMVIGFVTTGVMTLYQGMGVILGANIGTTVTMHILAIKLESLEWWLCAFGLLLLTLGWVNRRQQFCNAGLAILGFGLLFMGLTVLQLGVAPLQHEPFVIKWLTCFGNQPILAILVGALVTAIVQSSSAVSGIVLTIVRQGMLTPIGAIGIILGANIGTCVTAILAALKANTVGRRLAYFHIICNVFGVLAFIPILKFFTLVVLRLAAEPGQQIALAHTLFNVISAILLIPFMRPIERMLRPKE